MQAYNIVNDLLHRNKTSKQQQQPKIKPKLTTQKSFVRVSMLFLNDINLLLRWYVTFDTLHGRYDVMFTAFSHCSRASSAATAQRALQAQGKQLSLLFRQRPTLVTLCVTSATKWVLGRHLNWRRNSWHTEELLWSQIVVAQTNTPFIQLSIIKPNEIMQGASKNLTLYNNSRISISAQSAKQYKSIPFHAFLSSFSL